MTRSSVATVSAIAVVAYAADDLVHEIVGHYLTSLFVPTVKVVSLSTVAVQTTGASRFVAAGGTIANLLAGAIVLGLLRRDIKTITSRFFLWLFAAVNLLNGLGYLLFSGVLNIGDWAVVIAGLRPHWAWRLGMSVLGLSAYVAIVFVVARALNRMIDRVEVTRVVYVSYVTGGLLLTAGAAFNPISRMLILTSGVSTGFGAMVGLLFIPAIVERVSPQGPGGYSITFDRRWLLVGAIVGVAFIGVLGPGVRF